MPLLFRFERRGHQLAYGLEDDLELFIVLAELLFEFFQLTGQVLVRGEDFSQAHEGTDHLDARRDRNRTVENIRRHHSTVFRENKR